MLEVFYLPLERPYEKAHPKAVVLYLLILFSLLGDPRGFNNAMTKFMINNRTDV